LRAVLGPSQLVVAKLADLVAVDTAEDLAPRKKEADGALEEGPQFNRFHCELIEKALTKSF